MAEVASREELKQYCLRRLGAPVIQINVADEQLEDRIDDAFQMYQDYHYDAVEKYYWKHTITQTDIDNRYFPIDPSIFAITRIFPLNDSSVSSFNMFDMRYQMRLHDLYDFTSSSYTTYSITMQHLQTLSEMFTGEIPIRFQRHTNRLYVDMGWGTAQAPVGNMVIAEGYKIIDPEKYTDVYNDMWLKKYTTALFRKQWAENLRKFGSIPLPGGLVLNGEQMYQEAVIEIYKLEEEMQDRYSLPMDFFIG